MRTLTSSQNVGKVNKAAIVEIEIHVVSNKDREAKQIFDQRFEQYDISFMSVHPTDRFFTVSGQKSLSSNSWHCARHTSRIA
jgi:hypothetical protein